MQQARDAFRRYWSVVRDAFRRYWSVVRDAFRRYWSVVRDAFRRYWPVVRDGISDLAREIGELRRRLIARLRGPEPEAEAHAAPDVPRRVRGPRLPGAATIIAEREDDARAIIGRIDAASEVELLLVVPRRAYALRDSMEWPRIAAYVRQRGLRVRVLASRGDVRQHAADAGLPAARTVRGLRARRALRIPFGSREFVLRAPSLGPLVRAALFAGALFVIGLAACTYVPSATILVSPPAETLTVSIRARLSPLGEADLGLGVIAVDSVQTEVVFVVSTRSTGLATVGDTRARAGLTFTNAGDTDLVLPIGTPVETIDGVTFTTDRSVAIPAGSRSVVGATAIEPGSVGNVAADTLTQLSGFPATVSVTNIAAGGGTDIEVPIVSPDDVATVTELANAVLRRAGERELLRSVTDATVFTETIAVAIRAQTPLTEVGERSDILLMEYTATASAFVLTDEDAQEVAQNLLQERLPDGVALLPGTSVASLGDVSSFDGSRLTIEFTATGLASPLLDPSSLRGVLTNVSPEVAAERLREQLGLTTNPHITVHPGWIPGLRMPRRSDRISIELVSPEALAAAFAGEPAVDEEDAGGGDGGEVGTDGGADADADSDSG